MEEKVVALKNHFELKLEELKDMLQLNARGSQAQPPMEEIEIGNSVSSALPVNLNQLLNLSNLCPLSSRDENEYVGNESPLANMKNMNE